MSTVDFLVNEIDQILNNKDFSLNNFIIPEELIAKAKELENRRLIDFAYLQLTHLEVIDGDVTYTKVPEEILGTFTSKL